MPIKWQKASIDLPAPGTATPIPIVAHGLLSNPDVGDGRLIPVILLDLTGRSDVADLIAAQDAMPPGDVVSQWGRVSKSKRVLDLVLQFYRPVRCLAVIEFDVALQGFLIEAIMSSRALIIQPGQEGDLVSIAREKPKMIIEASAAVARSDWRKLWKRELVREMRRRGLGGGEARHAADAIIAEKKEMLRFRAQR